MFSSCCCRGSLGPSLLVGTHVASRPAPSSHSSGYNVQTWGRVLPSCQTPLVCEIQGTCDTCFSLSFFSILEASHFASVEELYCFSLKLWLVEPLVIPPFFMRNSTTLTLDPKEGGTTSVSSSQGSVRLFFPLDVSRNKRAFRVHRRALISIFGLQHNPQKSEFRVYKSEFRVFRYADFFC